MSASAEKVNLLINGETREVIYRTGEAPKVRERKTNNLTGTVNAPWQFLEPKKALYSPLNAHVQVDTDAGKVTLVLEAERYMGYPDNWTQYGISANGKQYALKPTHRYRQCGNGWATPVATWLGRRIVQVDTIIRKGAACA